MSEGYSSSPLDQAISRLQRNTTAINETQGSLDKLKEERKELVLRVKEELQKAIESTELPYELREVIADA